MVMVTTIDVDSRVETSRLDAPKLYGKIVSLCQSTEYVLVLWDNEAISTSQRIADIQLSKHLA